VTQRENSTFPWRRSAASGVTLLIVGSLWLPWNLSGRRSRNAFELLDLAEELNLGPSALRNTWYWLLPLVPLVAVLALVALWTGRSRWWRIFGLLLVLIVGVGVVAVVRAPTESAIGVGVAALSCVALLGFLLGDPSHSPDESVLLAK
jgi:fatty acid desaturase